MLNPRISHFGAHVDMIICVVVGCSKHSYSDKNVSFCRIPKRHNGKRELELPIRRRDGYLAAISRENIPAELWDEKILIGFLHSTLDI